MGIGGDTVVAALAGDDVEARLGDALRDAWEEESERVVDEVQPLDGAHDLIASLEDDGWEVVIASSSIEKHVDHFAGQIGAKELADGWTTKDDVEASKPDPGLVKAALAKTTSGSAVMVGDTPWDVDAARRAGVETICVMAGGFSAAELRESGASRSSSPCSN